MEAQTTTSSTPTVVKRGRGTFGQSMRGEGTTTNSAATTVSSAVDARQSRDLLNWRSENNTATTTPDEQSKPIRTPTSTTTVEDGKVTSGEVQPSPSLFAAETVREQLFRKDRRKRTVVFVGDMSEMNQRGIVRCYAFRGAKPSRLAKKFLRTVRFEMARREEETTSWTTVDASLSKKEEGPTSYNSASSNSAPIIIDSVTTTPPPTRVTPEMKVFAIHPNETRFFPAPCLTMQRFIGLAPFFHQELIHLWSLEDISKQRVTIRLEFGNIFFSANSSSSNEPRSVLDLATSIAKEAAQLFFINDAPLCVARALDVSTMGCVRAKYTLVKIMFFSYEKQTFVVARALWDCQYNSFQLVDIEHVGVTFVWTVLYADTEAPERRNIVPFEVQFRAFHRSKAVAGHPICAIARNILNQLTEAEHQKLQHGATSWDSIDFNELFSTEEEGEIKEGEKGGKRKKEAPYEVSSVTIEHVDCIKVSDGLVVNSSDSMHVERVVVRLNKNIPNEADGEEGKGGKERVELESESFSSMSSIQSNARKNNGISFVHSRSCHIHIKTDQDKTHEENLQPIFKAFELCEKIIRKASEIESNDEAPFGL